MATSPLPPMAAPKSTAFCFDTDPVTVILAARRFFSIETISYMALTTSSRDPAAGVASHLPPGSDRFLRKRRGKYVHRLVHLHLEQPHYRR